MSNCLIVAHISAAKQPTVVSNVREYESPQPPSDTESEYWPVSVNSDDEKEELSVTPESITSEVAASVIDHEYSHPDTVFAIENVVVL
jgi:hypothetical protein